jgi:cell division protein FtsQ
MSKRKQAVSGQSKKVRQGRFYQQFMLLVKNPWLGKLSLLVLLAGGLLAGLQQLNLSTVLPIESVQIEGEFRYLDKRKLQDSALPHVSGGFFSVNLDRIRNHLVELPWVEDVSIRRQWPNALRIRVMEKQPVAFWDDSEILSSRGSLFQPEVIDQDLRLPRLSGPGGQHKNMLMELGRMQAWLADTGLVIEHIIQDERRSWILTMQSGLELRLGRNDQHQRLHRFIDVYTDKLMGQKQNIKHIDMRYTNGLAVAWKKAKADLGA